MSVSTGLISGIDYSTMIDQLMQVEANPQTLLSKQLSATNADAAAYRAVNTRFEALRTAAAALDTDAAWTAAKASSSIGSVVATAGPAALPGSVSFTVDTLAAVHSQRSDTTFTVPSGQTTKDVDFGTTSLTVSVNGVAGSPIALDTDGNGTATLAEAAAAINARSDLGLTASLVQVAPGSYRLQVATSTAGLSGRFALGPGFTTLTEGSDAQLTVGTGTGKYTVTSPTNTFAGLLPDTTITVSKAGDSATVGIAKDPDAIAAKVQNLIDTANGLLDSVTSYTDPKNSSAILRGDSTLRGLAGQILDTVAQAVGGTSAAVAGLQLTRDGKFTFDKAKFTAKLATDPQLVRDLFTKKAVVDSGVDGIAGNADDRTTPLGISAKLEALAKSASDSSTGSLVLLAKGEDSLAKDLQARIDNWDIRLELRRTALTAQFTAMEKALGTMQNQASWLSSQIAGLPSWSQSSKS
ncbi:flagellar filament capping protein FliD [Blastococcus sp. SYSU D00695]